MPETSLNFEGRKFMWDGQEYETEDDAKKVSQGYEDDGFDVRLVSEEGKHLVYTRREVTEIVLEGAPPGV
ncbi:MAG: hypothetical protein KAW84_02020 [Thermoplasmata archaeon]|nr:hypothetical protein [Thermoplasmata archaeon]